jgi:hypothetical protein
MRALRTPVAFAILGILVPIVLLVADHMSPHGWWPDWIEYVWLTDYMLGATSAVVDRFWFEIAALSITLNAIIYAIAGAILVAGWRRLLPPGS